MTLVTGDDGRARCAWGAGDPAYRAYHDTEWGRPVTDERGLYEKLCLECLQSGLSWALILRKRDGIRAALAQFDPDAVAALGPKDVDRLLGDERVIRNRRKLEAIVQNARATLALRDSTPLPRLLWGFRAPAGAAADPKGLARELKRHGFVFVGPTTAYSTMQACGLVNDHDRGCFVYDDVEEEQRSVQDFSGAPS
jgi:DNA-3-methyladenine glycosylase I